MDIELARLDRQQKVKLRVALSSTKRGIAHEVVRFVDDSLDERVRRGHSFARGEEKAQTRAAFLALIRRGPSIAGTHTAVVPTAKRRH